MIEDRLITPPIDAPVLPARTLVLLPGVVAPLEVGREASRRAVEAAMAGDRRILIVPQRDPDVVDITPAELEAIGVEAHVLQSLPVGPGRYTIVVRVGERIRVGAYRQTEPYLVATGDYLAPPPPADDLSELVAAARERLAQALEAEAEEPDTAKAWLDSVDDAGALADAVASRLELSREQLLALLAEPDPAARLRMLAPALDRHLEVIRVRASIRDEMMTELSTERRAEMLRQRMRSIREELGEVDDDDALAELEHRVASAAMTDEARLAARRELRRLRDMSPESPEHTTAKTYVDWLCALPWQVEQGDEVDMSASRAILDADHEGLDEVKRRVLEFLAVRKLAPNQRAPILLFVGPPGVGKTSLGRSIARAMGRAYVRVSLGGVRDESEIRGHRRTYVGALPGRIVTGLKNAATANPVFVLDEVDKLAADLRGDPAAALLEVLDPEQNACFVDHYIEVPIDLSHVMFIATANTLDSIPGPLLDRMEVIHVPGYTHDQKRRIACRHLVPRELADHGLPEGSVTFTVAALDELVTHYTREAGVRGLRREIAAIARSLAVDAALADAWHGAVIAAADVARILGPHRFTPEVADDADAVGVATGLASTPTGGELLFVEARLMPGTGTLRVTGQVGSVMEESVAAAQSWVRANAMTLGIADELFRARDLHVHLPAGAIKKDGPAAGTAIATALVSLYTGAPVRHDVATTGELTLRGRVLAVGGIKDKLLAAHRAGVRTLVVPERNRKDTVDVPSEVLASLELRFAAHIEDVLAVALRQQLDPPRLAPPDSQRRGPHEPPPPPVAAA
jgi:ATP-dependent Lon protease